MKVTVVVPAYNEEGKIGKVLKGLRRLKLPVVIVDDGSSDKTFHVLSKFQTSDNKFQILRHKVNLGKGAAMKTGAEAAFMEGADAIIFMDSDGQHAISDVDKFREGLKTYEIVLGEREIVKGTPMRIYGSRMLSMIANFLFGVNVSDFLCGFRALTKNAYKKIKWESSDYSVETEMIARIGKEKISYGKVTVKSIYHDVYKGFSVMDGLKLLYNIVSWRFTI